MAEFYEYLPRTDQFAEGTAPSPPRAPLGMAPPEFENPPPHPGGFLPTPHERDNPSPLDQLRRILSIPGVREKLLADPELMQRFMKQLNEEQQDRALSEGSF